MRYHDYHLESYEVADRGEKITLNLVYGYPGEETDKSVITFEEVALYNFVHTTGAIITDIEEEPVGSFLGQISGQITEWNRMHGVRYWKEGFESYVEGLAEKGFKAWRIESAIGFYGFVVAKRVENA